MGHYIRYIGDLNELITYGFYKINNDEYWLIGGATAIKINGEYVIEDINFSKYSANLLEYLISVNNELISAEDYYGIYYPFYYNTETGVITQDGTGAAKEYGDNVDKYYKSIKENSPLNIISTWIPFYERTRTCMNMLYEFHTKGWVEIIDEKL